MGDENVVTDVIEEQDGEVNNYAKELREEIKLDLGGDIVSLGISNNTIDMKIKEAVRKVTAYAPVVVVESLPCSNGQVELPKGTTSVIAVYTMDVSEVTSAKINMEDDINLFSARRYLLGSDPLKDPYIYLMHKTELDTLQTFISIEDYMYDKGSRKLFINNYTKPNATIKYFMRTDDINDIEDPDVLQIIKEYALALCKIIEGNIRRKLQNAPGAIQMDGDALVSEGTAERDRLDERISKEFPNIRFGIRA